MAGSPRAGVYFYEQHKIIFVSEYTTTSSEGLRLLDLQRKHQWQLARLKVDAVLGVIWFCGIFKKPFLGTLRNLRSGEVKFPLCSGHFVMGLCHMGSHVTALGDTLCNIKHWPAFQERALTLVHVGAGRGWLRRGRVKGVWSQVTGVRT